MRHIIVEGPDGSGKTNLIQRLVNELNMPVHPKASDSKTGPHLPTLDAWVDNDLKTMHEQCPSIYDRHPLISELIYGPICRSGVPGKFNDKVWVSTSRRLVAKQSVVIRCLPSLRAVRKNVQNEDIPQMPGVVDCIDEIYFYYGCMGWPGTMITWNYEKHEFNQLARTLRIMVKGENVG
jgi:GTPase SAR1 family protein